MFIMKTELLVSLLCISLCVAAAADVNVKAAELSNPADGEASDAMAKALKGYTPAGGFRSSSVEERAGPFCPQGWLTYRDHCYQLFTYLYSWNNAEFLCENVGANLASAHNVDDYKFLQQMARDARFTTAWIGGYAFQGYWKWDDGTPFDYDNWFSQGSSYSYACINLSTEGAQGWSSQDCKLGKPFICSKKRC